MLPVVAVLLAAAAQGGAAPSYRYVEVPRVAPGSTLYAFMDARHGGHVPVGEDVFAFIDVVKSAQSGDQAGLDELKAAGRLFAIPTGTAVRILEYHDATVAKMPAYEVRVLDGKHAGKKGWTAALWLRGRVEAPTPPRRRGQVKSPAAKG